MESVLSPSSLRLLVPPLRVMLAVMWKTVRQRNIRNYGKVEEFVSLVSEAVPDILTNRQMRLLTLGLRAKMTLHTLHSGQSDDLSHVRTLLDELQSASSKQLQPEIEGLEENFIRLVQSLVEDINRREHFFKNVYPDEYGPTFDTALETMLWDFFSRLEELLFIPNLKQAAVWISDSSSVLEEYMQCETEAEDLRLLLRNKEHHGKLSKSKSSGKELSPSEEELFFALSLPASLTTTTDGESEKQSNETQKESEVISVLEAEETVIEDERCSDENETEQSNEDQTTAETCSDGIGYAPVEEDDDDDDEAPSSSTNCPVVSGSLLSVAPQRVAQKCDQCGKCFIYPYELQAHLRIHTGECPYKCSQCGKAFRTSSDLSSHRRSQCADALYLCIKCGTGFQSPQEKMRHRCVDAKTFDCSQCGRAFKRRNTLNRHVLTHNRGSVLTCRVCKEAFPNVREVRAHEMVHPKTFPCVQCTKAYHTRKALLDHMLRHKQTKTSEICPYCGKAFKSKHYLDGHIRIHTGERPHKCTFCGRCFTMAGNLKVHLRLHTGERPYKCADCEKGFTSAGELQIHRRTHTGERPYKCTVCDRTFTMASKVTVHMRVHTGERPYLCDVCGKGFARGSERNKHVLVHTGARPFVCQVCARTFTRQRFLYKHMKSHSEPETPAV